MRKQENLHCEGTRSYLVITSLLLTLALAACGDKKKDDSKKKNETADKKAVPDKAEAKAEAKKEKPAEPAKPTPASPPKSGKTYYIQVVGGDFLTSPNAKSSQTILVAPLKKSSKQRWQLTKKKDGTFNVMSVSSGLNIDAGDDAKAGENVMQYKRDTSKTQRWSIIGAAKGQYNLLSKSRNFYMTRKKHYTVLQPADDSNNQKWMFFSVDQM